jgi:hypothetical protein
VPPSAVVNALHAAAPPNYGSGGYGGGYDASNNYGNTYSSSSSNNNYGYDASNNYGNTYSSTSSSNNNYGYGYGGGSTDTVTVRKRFPLRDLLTNPLRAISGYPNPHRARHVHGASTSLLITPPLLTRSVPQVTYTQTYTLVLQPWVFELN